MQKNGIHYEILGQGAPFVLLHGWGGSIKSLSKLQSELAKKYKTISIDLPGFGESQEPTSIIGIDEYAFQIQELLKSLRINKYYLFGHSFGGQVAGQMALQFPDAITALVFCNAALVRKISTKSKILQIVSKFLRFFRLGFISKIIFRNSDYTKASPQMREIMKVILKQDLTDKLSSIKVPALVLWGENDTLTPLWQARIIVKLLPQAKLVTFPNVRHNLPLLYPEKVVFEINKFIGGLK